MSADPAPRVSPSVDGERSEVILAELEKRGAGQAPHGRRNVLSHLQGTHAVLAAWGQPARVRLAGLLHNAYGTDAFHGTLFDPARRDLVRDLLGRDAENLVHLYCAVDRSTLMRHCSRPAEDRAARWRPMDRHGGVELDVGPRELGDLLVMHLANVAEQACLADGAPTCWLASARALAVHIAERAETVPGLLDVFDFLVTREDEERALEAYDTALRTLAVDAEAALGRMAAASAILAGVAELVLWLSCAALLRGDRVSARDCVSRALAMANAWGTPWDKRLTLAQWCDVGAALGHLAEAADAPVRVSGLLERVVDSPADLYQALVESGVLASASGAQKPADRARVPSVSTRFPPRFLAHVGRCDRDGRPGRQVGSYPGLRAHPWHDERGSALARALETAADEIAVEFRRIARASLVDEGEQIARTGRWSISYLVSPDGGLGEAAIHCPRTMALLDAHREEAQGAGVAYFSCLDPHTRVAQHRGPTNTRLRCHLGLEVPPGCGLRVAGEQRTWQPGRALLFDDSFMHEVWNDSAHRRVVLIVDVWHPDLDPQEIELLKWFHA